MLPHAIPNYFCTLFYAENVILMRFSFVVTNYDSHVTITIPLIFLTLRNYPKGVHDIQTGSKFVIIPSVVV
jgi:hypothetical protein